MLGFIIGSFVAQFAGAGAYWQIRSRDSFSNGRPWVAAATGGVAYTLVASAIYIPFQVHTWLLGEGTSWGLSVFMAVVMSLVQAILLPGRPWPRHRPQSTS